MMKLKEILDLLADMIDVQLICGVCQLHGNAESIRCLLDDAVMNYNARNIEPRENTLWIWVEEDEG